MFFHKHEAPSPITIFWHDGYWELRRGSLVVERFYALPDALRFLAQFKAKAA